MLDRCGLHQLTWNLADQTVSDIPITSPMGAEGRGIALSLGDDRYISTRSLSETTLRSLGSFNSNNVLFASFSMPADVICVLFASFSRDYPEIK